MTFNVYNAHVSSKVLHQNEALKRVPLMKTLSRAYDFLRQKVCSQRRQNANKAAVVTESTARVFTAFARVLLISKLLKTMSRYHCNPAKYN